MRSRNLYVVWRDPEGKGFWHGPHGKYTDRIRAEIFAGELARRLGGCTKITVEREEVGSRVRGKK
jgi:hypothetical protein